VADSRPSEPPRAIGLPVMTAGFGPYRREYSSAIHPMIWGLVLTSGAGTSTFGPMASAMPRMNARDNRSSSASDRSFGSTCTPPLPPPKGMFMSAVFHVMSMAKHRTSSKETVGWNRSPPLNGPRALLCCTRYPLNTLKPPPSMGTRTWTVTSRVGVDSASRSESSSWSRSAACS
jgi:hypothetical protein